jgi:hypothetical protein
LRILDLAEADLLRGFRFYERKSPGVGWVKALARSYIGMALY